jgi:hypothetical protein
MNLGFITSFAKRFIDDQNRKLVGCEGVGGSRYYDEYLIRNSPPDAYKREKQILALLSVKKRHDMNATAKGGTGRPQGGEPVEKRPSNAGLEMLLRAVLRALIDRAGIHCSMCGPTLLAWKWLSLIPPWEKDAFIMVAEVKDIDRVYTALRTNLGPAVMFSVVKDAGGIAVKARQALPSRQGESTVRLVFKCDDRDLAAESAAAGITADMSRRIKISKRDLLPSSCAPANLGGTVLVPAHKVVTRTLHRWYHGGKDVKKALPSINAPRPWVWHQPSKQFAKTSMLSYYLRPPYGKKTVLAASLLVTVFALCFLAWTLMKGWVKIDNVQPAPSCATHHDDGAVED